MLVISRRNGEGFVLRFSDRPDIHVRVVEFWGDPTNARLAIKADAGVEVIRDELVAGWDASRSPIRVRRRDR